MTSTVPPTDPKDLYSILNRGLPNIATYIKVILKREKLSEEAEGVRARYETILTSLEQGTTTQRPVSIICDDDGGYFSGNRQRVTDVPSEQFKGVPDIDYSGYLLRRDDKYRWHRSWCKVDSKEMKFFIYEDLNEEILVRSFSLSGVSTRFGSHPVPESDKENSFAICGIGCAIEPLNMTSATSEPSDPNGLVTPAPPTTSSSVPTDEAYFAAYSESDYRQWKDILHMLTASRDSSRISFSFLDNTQWLSTGTHDSTSTSSSSFSSNRESMISTTSSLLNNRMSAKIDEGKVEHTLADDSKGLSASKQQQPLPSPPHVLPEDIPLPDDDNASDGTIYESIDNLVSQFDDAMRATAAAMGQIGQSMKSGGKKRKKKHNIISRQHSFLSRAKSQKSNFLADKKSELEKGEKFSGFLFKRTSSGSWKKRWCTLKGCVFGYYKSAEDSHGREYVLLNAEVNRIEDQKRSFAFSLTCKGVEEMYFAAEDDDLYATWLARITAASRNYGEYADAWSNWQDEDSTPGDTQAKLGDGIYNVPRSLPLDRPLGSDYPRGPNPPLHHLPPAPAMTPEMAIDTGIYSVPRSLFMVEDVNLSQPLLTPQGTPAFYNHTGNSSDIYDVPRASMSPDEEGIYDDPFDILDMEIYDYPPDVNELDRYLEDSGLDTTENSTRNSTITMTSDYTATDRTSSTLSEDSWRTMSLPPIPPGVRPYSMVSSDEYQSNRNSMISMDGGYTLPRNLPPAELPLKSIFERPGESNTSLNTVDSNGTPDYPDASSLEFGQCIIRGHLYKRERFMTWSKLYCIIRNNFLECHKSHGGGYMPALKLFLPGSEVKQGGGDAKRKNAFQVKHPRRDGMLVFATETTENFHQWIKAFQSGATIEVQPVNTVEEMRITDLEMQRRWTNVDKDPFNDMEGQNGTLPRRKTFSNDSKPVEDYSTDTLKRRRRFTFGKMKRKSKDEKKLIPHSSTPDLKRAPATLPPSMRNFTQEELRRSVSCEELPTAGEPGMTVESHQIMGADGRLKFQGYLSVHRHGANTNFIRYWCVFDGIMINCYINQLDLTLTMSVSLPGSQISEASSECGRPHSYKVWHMETGQCIYFSADSGTEFQKWFSQVTQHAEQIQAPPQPTGEPGKVVYFVLPGSGEAGLKPLGRTRSNSLPMSPVDDHPGDNESVGSSNTGQGSSDTTTPVSAFYRGHLKKASHTGKWKNRYCVVKEGNLSLFHSQSDKSPIVSIELFGCSIELVNVPRQNSQRFVFKLKLASSEKEHTFAAPSETEMYAWVSALRDSSYEKLDQHRSLTELSTGGSGNNSPALSGKSSLRKRGSKSKLTEVDLVSYVTASSLKSPDIAGFADVQVTTDSWNRFWCVVHSDCLYIYQSQTSQATVKTVVLPGYDIHVADPLIYKRQYAILLSHNGVAPVCVAVNDEVELNQWLAFLDKASRAEGLNGKQTNKPSTKPLLDESTKALTTKVSSKSGTAKKKGPMKADHSINTVKNKEDAGGSADSSPASLGKTSEAHQDSIIRRYEKRIRKTHRVANQTEQKLKEHQTALLHFKKELSRHVVKLQELASSGETNAQRRLTDIRKKLQQVDKIVPYLGKYISVNRQAEQQTVAVLKESCTMEIQKMARSPSKNNFGEVNASGKSSAKTVGKEQTDNPAEEIKTETVSEMAESPQAAKLVEENPYASLSEVRPQVEKAKQKSNYAQLDFSRVPSPGGTLRPPSVNYAEVKIGSFGKGIIVDKGPSLVTQKQVTSTPVPAVVEEVSVQPQESANVAPEQSPQKENVSSTLDNTLTPENAATIVSLIPSTPNNLETVTEASFTHTPPLSPIAHESQIINSTEEPIPKCPPSVPERSSSLEPSQEQTESSLAPAPTSSTKAKSPPPRVARKPSKQSTPARQWRNSQTEGSPPTNGFRDSICSDISVGSDVNSNGNLTDDGAPNEQASPARKDASAVLTTAPSVMDRIKALQKQKQ